MSDANNGGPAFPVLLNPGQPWQGMEPCDGMSLRDYFATHSTQPGVAEIVKAAGIGMDRYRRVYVAEDSNCGIHFDDWWQSQTLDRQCELSALVRYAQADAMLKVRAALPEMKG